MKLNEMKIFKFDFSTDYHQFYILDKPDKGMSPAKVDWGKQDLEDRLLIGKGILAVSTGSLGPIKGEIKVLASENTNFNEAIYDHIVEGSIEINSGDLQIVNCPIWEVELEIKLQKGRYRVRVYSKNLTNIDELTGGDYYIIEIWPSSDYGRNVIKKYVPKYMK